MIERIRHYRAICDGCSAEETVLVDEKSIPMATNIGGHLWRAIRPPIGLPDGWTYTNYEIWTGVFCPNCKDAHAKK